RGGGGGGGGAPAGGFGVVGVTVGWLLLPLRRAPATPPAATVATTAEVGNELIANPAGRAGKTAAGPVGEMGATGASFLQSSARRTTSGSNSPVRLGPTWM